MSTAGQEAVRVGPASRRDLRGGPAGSSPASRGMAGHPRGRTGLALLACWLLITTSWWTLALAPVASSPPWLRALRDVCFGSTASGLPDTYGWLLLAAAPGTMLVALLVTWRREIASDLAALAELASGRVLLVIVAMLLMVGSSAAALRIAGGLSIENASFAPADDGALPADYPRLGLTVPPLALVDQQGRAFTNADLSGRVTLLTFAFAHCRTVCPAIVQSLRTTIARMGDRAPQVAVVTLDPWRDTPSRLPQMAEEWQMPPAVRVLSGEVTSVTSALDGLNVPWKRDETTGDVVHPALVYVVGADGRVAYGFNNPTPDWLVEALGRVSGGAGGS